MSETPKRKARIFYARVDEFWRKEEKYAYLDEKQHRGNIEWQEIQPDAKHLNEETIKADARRYRERIVRSLGVKTRSE